MRLYTFTLYQLRSIQQGIQPLHVLGEMAAKYGKADHGARSVNMFYDYVTNHKTVICLNGGNAASLKTIEQELNTLAHHMSYPYAYFCEDEESLDGVMTSVGIIVPTHVYEWAAKERMGTNIDAGPVAYNEYHPADLKLATLINKFPLAS